MTTNRLTVTCLSAALALSLPAAAQAWSTPYVVDASKETMLGAPAVGSNQAGFIVAAWPQGQRVMARVRSGGTWGAPIEVYFSKYWSVSGIRVAVSATGKAVVTWTESTTPANVQAALFDGRAWSAPRVLSTVGATASLPQAGMDDAGQATVAWEESTAGACAIRSVTGTVMFGWEQPMTVAAECYSWVKLAENGRGEAALVWGVSWPSGPVRGATRSIGGKWGLPVQIAASQYRQHSPTVGIGEDGTAVTVWSVANGIWWSREMAGGAWSPAAVLFDGNASGDSGVAVDGQGNAVAAFSTWENSGNTSLMVSKLPRNGAWSTPGYLMNPNTQTLGFFDVSATRAGTFLVGSTDMMATKVTASTLAPGASTWTKKVIGNADQNVAVCAESGNAVVLWNTVYTMPYALKISTSPLP